LVSWHRKNARFGKYHRKFIVSYRDLVLCYFCCQRRLLASVRGLHLTKNAMGGRGEHVRRINLGRPPAVVEPHPRELRAQARRLSLTLTMPPSTLAPTRYATGDALAPVRRMPPPPELCCTTPEAGAERHRHQGSRRCRSGRGRKPVNGRSRLGTGSHLHPLPSRALGN